MGLLDAYQDSTDTVLNVMAARPLEPEAPKPKHSAWSVLPRAMAAGVQEVAGNVLDTASAFGQVAAASGGLTPGFDPDAKKNRAQTLEAYDKLKTEGINWRSEEGQVYYDFARNLRPDPLTAGAAEQVVFGLGKGLTKAIGAAATLGTAGGAVAFGTSEGMTTAEDLAVQGVDQATRTKAGAVAGVINAAGIALPVAGRTLAETAGLVLVGGPGSFVAQQQLTRSILENANYGEIAKQFDPLDPVGLVVSTLLPAGFAAYAKRGGFAAKPAPKADGQTEPEIAPQPQEVAPVEPAVAPIAATQDNIDAAMVHNLTAARDANGDAPPPEVAPSVGNPDTPTPTAKDSSVVQPEPAVVRENRTTETPDAYTARLDALLTEKPDMITRMDDAGQPVRLADELASLKKRAEEGTDDEFGAIDAPLLQIAAECAITFGGG